MPPKRWLSFLVCLVLLGSATDLRTQSHDGPAKLRDPIAEHLRGAVDEGFSGVVLIARDGKILFHRAFSADSTVTPESAFWIGSVTKPFTAAAIMMLQEEGEIAVADPIAEHIPDVPPDQRYVSVHHLLTHTWGVGTHYAADTLTDRKRALRALLTLPVEHSPGTFAYSNDGYSLLALLIDLVSEEGYEGYLQTGLLDPVGMDGAGFWWVDPSEKPSLAPVKNRPHPSRTRPTWGYRGATGLYATALDLCRWDRALATDSVLSDFSREVILAPHVPLSDTRAYGYGWEIIDSERGRIIAHFGANSELGHQADLKRYVDRDLVTILLSNGPEDVATEAFAEAEEIFFRNQELYSQELGGPRICDR